MVLIIFNTGSILSMLENINSTSLSTSDAEETLFYRTFFKMGTYVVIVLINLLLLKICQYFCNYFYLQTYK